MNFISSELLYFANSRLEASFNAGEERFYARESTRVFVHSRGVTLFSADNENGKQNYTERIKAGLSVAYRACHCSLAKLIRFPSRKRGQVD